MADEGRGFAGLRHPSWIHNREGVATRAEGRLPARKRQGHGLAAVVEPEVRQDVPPVVGAGEAAVSSPEVLAPPGLPVPCPNAVRIEGDQGEGVSQLEAAPGIE